MNNPKSAQALQDKIYQKMSAKKKIEIVSQFILLAKKLSESKTIPKNKRENDS